MSLPMMNLSLHRNKSGEDNERNQGSTYPKGDPQDDPFSSNNCENSHESPEEPEFPQEDPSDDNPNVEEAREEV